MFQFHLYPHSLSVEGVCATLHFVEGVCATLRFVEGVCATLRFVEGPRATLLFVLLRREEGGGHK